MTIKYKEILSTVFYCHAYFLIRNSDISEIWGIQIFQLFEDYDYDLKNASNQKHTLTHLDVKSERVFNY